MSLIFLNFNSHTPREVWRELLSVPVILLVFQLTHPSRGVAVFLNQNSDYLLFQLTHPSRGVAIRDFQDDIIDIDISTHTPLARCGSRLRTSPSFSGISTHTPLARCGGRTILSVRNYNNFNSHTPREVWRHINKRPNPCRKFQLTHPSRGVAFSR